MALPKPQLSPCLSVPYTYLRGPEVETPFLLYLDAEGFSYLQPQEA